MLTFVLAMKTQRFRCRALNTLLAFSKQRGSAWALPTHIFKALDFYFRVFFSDKGCGCLRSGLRGDLGDEKE